MHSPLLDQYKPLFTLSSQELVGLWLCGQWVCGVWLCGEWLCEGGGGGGGDGDGGGGGDEGGKRYQQ
jgi:hypothetical protein